MDCATGGQPAPQQPLGESVLDHVEGTAGEAASTGDADTWRREVAVRLESYRARRKPRAPRYPSLFLPFDPPALRARTSAPDFPTAPAAQACASLACPIEEEPLLAAAPVEGSLAIIPDPDPVGNVIEFPRSAAIPVFQGPELADPVLDRPRILEAPEIVPPPPALGGILIEPAASLESEGKPNSDLPASPATILQRLAAGLIDGLILGAALAAFAAIFLRLNPERAPLAVLFGSFLAVSVLLWCAYQFLFVVYTGATPGMLVLKLRFARFDGSPVRRGLRRWRVLASFLSASALGLGYLWALLDEDGLCWHDRITRTCMRPGPHNENASRKQS